ncbi:MAG: tetratricopeptide repeat protein, partial [Candidatus Saccharimonas sp.]|nr:tetratricopeptide repeat protein [Planctomycetaceae bacterium]
ELYQKAMALAPEAAQYKEYLGEYFHSLKRKDEAMATWRQMADGKAKTAANVARLAEVLSGFGYLTEAVETNAEACKLDPKEINLQIKQVDLLSQAEKHEDALKQLDVVKKLAANDEEREAWLGRELKELQAIDKLKERVAALSKELVGPGDKGTAGLGDKAKAELADKWFWLARAYEAQRELKEAGLAVTKASDLAPQSIPILMSSARILEAQNNLLAAVEINTKLAAVDRRYRTEYLKKVAQLEMQLGRRDKAIQAGRDLLAAAPGNPELYEFFSQLCFQLGEAEEGLQALRRSVRVNPTEPKGLLLLASALGEQFRTSEAIELYWRAFEKAGNLEDRLGVVPKLAELYLQTNQFDRLLERLERQRREPNQQREMTICLAQAYQSAGDDGNARQELEKLLTEDSRDTQLLTQLVKLCETDGDLDVAVRYQQQLNKASPGKEGMLRLAQLLMKAGETAEATALMAQLTGDEKDPEQVMKSIDSLLNTKQFEQALTIIAKLTRDQPKNWELLYREGVALAKAKPEEAAKRFEAILALKEKDGEQSLAAKSAAKKAAKSPRGQLAMGPFALQQQQHSLQYRIQHVYTIRRAVNLDGQDYYSGQQQQPFWAPIDFGQARLAAFAWQMAFAQNGGKLDEFIKARKDSAAQATDRRDLIDWYYLASLKQDGKEQYRILKQLSLRPDADREIKQTYLYSLAQRGPAEGDAAVAEADSSDAAAAEAMDEETDFNGNRVKLAPLGKDELEHVIKIAREAESLTDLGQHNWGVGTSLELIAAELKRSGRKDEAEKMYADALAKAKEPTEIATVLHGTVQRGDFDTALKLLDRLAELAAKQGTQPAVSTSVGFNYAQYISTPQYQSQILGQLMSKRVRTNQKAKKDDALDGVFPLWTRYLNLVTARNAAPVAQTAAAKKARAVNPYGNQNYYTVWRINGQQNGEQVDFPQPNDVYDHSTIQMLRQMFALYRETEQAPALTEAFASALKDPQTSAAQRQFWQFGLGYLHWWNDEKDEALAALSDAIQKVPENTEFKFELARLHEKRREFSEALTLIDALTPSDQAELQKREVMALRLAVNSGDIDRARAAADRLFGLRLDSTLQMALAKQMHQLGMHEQAEAVLARAGRQAGNKTDVLSSLMEQYASTGKNEVAVQIAHQLLRRSKPSSSAGQMQRQRNNDGTDPTRTQALQVLNRSGKLPEMIAKVESQLKNSPKSQRLLETLLEYHVAAGNDKKVEELNAKLSESKVDNPAFRYQLAMKLLDAGKTKEANEHLKIVFEKEPRLAMNNYWELQQKYEQHNKIEDLASLYESMNLKVFRQNSHIVSNAISNMMNREQTKDRAMTLFKKAWKELPEARSQLLGNMHDEKFWKLPEIYDYAREGVIPTELGVQSNRFQGFGTSYSYGQDGKITTIYTRILDMSVAQKKLDPLGEDVAAAIKKMPTWTGGKALAAMIDLRKGRIEEGKAVFTTMLPTFDNLSGNDVYYAGRAVREIGQELMAHDSCADLAIKYFELAMQNDRDQNEFQYTAGKPLMLMLKKQGRKAEARQVLIDGTNPRENDYGNGPEYAAYRRVASAVSIGNEFKELGYPADAIK